MALIKSNILFNITVVRLLYTAILRKVVRRNVHARHPGRMGYDEYAVSDTVAVESSIDASL